MKTTRICLTIALAMLSLTVAGSDRAFAAKKITAEGVPDIAATSPLHAARLRKLHLVRPDLINYPLSFDVVC